MNFCIAENISGALLQGKNQIIIRLTAAHSAGKQNAKLEVFFSAL